MASHFKLKIEKLEHFLPSHNDLLSYSHEDFDKIRAYIVLCHAETEHYIEKLCLKLTETHFNYWHSNKLLTPIILNICINFRPKIFYKNKHNFSNELIYEGKEAFKNYVRGNHSIYSDKIEKIFRIINFEFNEIDMNDLKSFAKIRGEFAHKSSDSGNYKTAEEYKKDTLKITNIIQTLESYCTTNSMHCS